MKAQYESQLYEIERVPIGFATILGAYGLNTYVQRGLETRETPSVEIVMTAGQLQDRRFLRNPGNAWSGAQPYNAWLARFEIDVTSNRQTNATEHIKYLGVVRMEFQTYRMLETWTESISPYHAISTMIERDESLEMQNEDDTDTTRLVFEGIINIRDDAWPIPVPLQQSFPELFDLVNGETFLLQSGDNFDLAS